MKNHATSKIARSRPTDRDLRSGVQFVKSRSGKIDCKPCSISKLKGLYMDIFTRIGLNFSSLVTQCLYCTLSTKLGEKLTIRSYFDDHLLVHAHVAHEGAELVEADLAVVVLVGELDRLVDDLLQLRVLQVRADHLEELEELPVADEAVVVDVVDLEGELELRHLVALW